MYGVQTCAKKVKEIYRLHLETIFIIVAVFKVKVRKKYKNFLKEVRGSE
jgi:hypothetical protein